MRERGTITLGVEKEEAAVGVTEVEPKPKPKSRASPTKPKPKEVVEPGRKVPEAEVSRPTKAKAKPVEKAAKPPSRKMPAKEAEKREAERIKKLKDVYKGKEALVKGKLGELETSDSITREMELKTKMPTPTLEAEQLHRDRELRSLKDQLSDAKKLSKTGKPRQIEQAISILDEAHSKIEKITPPPTEVRAPKRRPPTRIKKEKPSKEKKKKKKTEGEEDEE
jgi:hypothetical protein